MNAKNTNETENQEKSADTPYMQIRAQYVKDLSFENPNAPNSLFSASQRPTIDVNIDLKAQKFQDDIYEVVMILSVRAHSENTTIFLTEISYAGIFQVNNIAPEQLEQILLVDAPFIMFPYLRRIVSDVTRDGGFPPLMLEPIDFHQLFLNNKSKS